VEILDFGGPMEVFVYAGYKVFTVSKNKKPIQSQGVLTIVPDYSIDDAPKADILAFFGGNSVNAYKNTKVIDWVKEQKEVSYHFSVCTGAFVLAEAGILKGKTATTFHDVLDKLESDYPEIEVRREARFVDNGNVITTAGVSAGIDGALHLVAKLQGLNAAKRAAYYMEYDNWQPGNGLILSNDNPYLDPPKLEELASFTGTYQFKDDLEVVVTVDEENDQLSARVANNVYPMYYESRDLFSDVGNEPIFFQRNEKDEIIGYKLSLDGKIYQKLN
ncbi:MAG: DJ-1/PfpI family protein, partial [Bacteroidota bacterium]